MQSYRYLFDQLIIMLENHKQILEDHLKILKKRQIL